MTQIMKLLHLAPDIQEQILFLPHIEGLNERNLRSIVSRIDWDEQRRACFKRSRTVSTAPGDRPEIRLSPTRRTAAGWN